MLPRKCHFFRAGEEKPLISRLKNLGQDPKAAYADYEEIEEELKYAKRFFRQHPWAVIDVSSKAVEETANEVLVRLGLK